MTGLMHGVTITLLAVAIVAGAGAWWARAQRRVGPTPIPTPAEERWLGHRIEEEIPGSEFGRPARWVEVTRTAIRVDADRRLAELMRTHPRATYRMVSLPDRPASSVTVPDPAVPYPAAPLSIAAETRPLRPRQETPHMTSTPVPARTTDSLWLRLRQHTRTDDVTAVVAHALYVRILGPRGTDPRESGEAKLVPFFIELDGSLIDRDRLERHMSHFLMAALGGPKRYTGRGMAAAHASRWITDEAFDRVLGHVGGRPARAGGSAGVDRRDRHHGGAAAGGGRDRPRRCELTAALP